MTPDDWSLLARLVGGVAPYEPLVAVWRSVFERPQNHSLIVMKNVKDHGYLSCWQQGGYSRLVAREAVVSALHKPLQALRVHAVTPLPAVLEECLGAGTPLNA